MKNFWLISILLFISIQSAITAASIDSSYLYEYNYIVGRIGKPNPGVDGTGKIPAQSRYLADTNCLIYPSETNANQVLIRRTKALYNFLKSNYDVNLPSEEQSLQSLSQQAQGNGSFDLFKQICAVRRKITLANPLLDFDTLVYVEENARRPVGGFGNEIQKLHNNGIRGGGVFKVGGIKSANQTVTSILPPTVTVGSRTGRKWTDGAFNCVSLSYDGKTALFAWATSPAPGWNTTIPPTGSYKIYSINTDGTNLRQLTSNDSINDGHAVFLPNGRIVFVSEWRNGAGAFARCHPGSDYGQKTATLHTMKSDGSDIICISWHETNDLYPWVDNDGRIVYTRWDYIDRDFNTAHHIWICGPDGTDPRAPHGNYPLPHFRGDNIYARTTEFPYDSSGAIMIKSVGFETPNDRASRPWAELYIKSVPGRNGIYSAVAAQHHQSAYGPIILIDINVEDDSRMKQVKRVNLEGTLPQENFNSSKMSYGWYTAPYPLSESFFIATDPGCEVTYSGIYLVDKFGNRELLHNGPANRSFAALHATPLRSRKVPPVKVSNSWQEASKYGSPDHKRATISVANVYESDFDWPANTRITKLRVIQIVGKPFYGHSWNKGKYHTDKDQPRIGYALGGIPRIVLGTVPVESDGSAYFEAPVGKEIYFQALNDSGCAVQSMRSGTYVHPGEQMSCLGCHENKWFAVKPPSTPKAMQRAPSQIQPDVAGSTPMSFGRLALPILMNKCTPCHKQSKASNPTLKCPIITDSLVPNPRATGVGHLSTAGYQALEPYSFYFHGEEGKRIYDRNHGGSRTQAGFFGAKAAPLYSKLFPSHHNVNLTADEFHRITLWLDCNSQELGTYSMDTNDIRDDLKGVPVYPEFEFDPNNPTGVEANRPGGSGLSPLKQPLSVYKFETVKTDFYTPIHKSIDAPLIFQNKGNLFIRSNDKSVFVSILNLQGKLLSKEKINLQNGIGRIKINRSKIAQGLYTFAIKYNSGEISQKLMLSN